MMGADTESNARIGTAGGAYNQKTGRSDAVLNHVDIAPTTLGLCGIDTPESMKGFDYSGLCVAEHRPEYRGGLTGEPPESAYLQQIPRKMHSHSVNRAAAARRVAHRDRQSSSSRRRRLFA